MDKKVAVLLCGPACSGKTTFAMYLNAAIRRSIVLSMATGVKDVATKMSWDGEKDTRGRKLLQDIGSIGREYWEDLWVMQAVSSFSSIAMKYDVLIIDDTRYRNEVDVLGTYFDDVMVIRLHRVDAGLSGNAAKHESELWYKTAPVSGHISNNGTLDELRNAAQGVAEFVLEVLDAG